VIRIIGGSVRNQISKPKNGLEFRLFSLLVGDLSLEIVYTLRSHRSLEIYILRMQAGF